MFQLWTSRPGLKSNVSPDTNSIKMFLIFINYICVMRIKIPIKLAELEANNFHLIVHSEFQNGKTGKWIIDTGASKSVFDKNLVELFDVSESETEEIYSAGIMEKPLKTSLAVLNPFSFGKLRIENFKVALLDLSHINKLYEKNTGIKICGLLGSDFFVFHKATIDYKKLRILLFA